MDVFLIPTDEEKREPAIYLRRLSGKYPNFPDQVIKQWFYDHHYQVSEYDWLDFKKLTFEKVSWETQAVPTMNIGNDACVKSYRENYASGRSSNTPRFKRIGDYFLEFGTWPVPPIFLYNPDKVFKFDGGFPCGCPFHLVEGHNRLAQFITGVRLLEHHEAFIASVRQ